MMRSANLPRAQANTRKRKPLRGVKPRSLAPDEQELVEIYRTLTPSLREILRTAVYATRDAKKPANRTVKHLSARLMPEASHVDDC